MSAENREQLMDAMERAKNAPLLKIKEVPDARDDFPRSLGRGQEPVPQPVRRQRRDRRVEGFPRMSNWPVYMNEVMARLDAFQDARVLDNYLSQVKAKPQRCSEELYGGWLIAIYPFGEGFTFAAHGAHGGSKTLSSDKPPSPTARLALLRARRAVNAQNQAFRTHYRL
jgi:hypothetical protein